jgi:beta-propeller repeat-containing protein
MRLKKCRLGSVTIQSRIGWMSLLISGALAAANAVAPLPGEHSGPPVSGFQSNEAARSRARESYGNLAQQFEANRGQTDPRVKFLSRGSGYTLFLTSTEARLTLIKSGSHEGSKKIKALSHLEQEEDPTRIVFSTKFVDANPESRVMGQEDLPGKVNYFIGRDPMRSRSNVPTYAKVQYHDLYPDIDLVYYGNQRQLEYDFVVRPHADPTRIALCFEGADRLEVDAQGDLILYVGDGAIRQRKPVIYQEVQGVRKEIQGGYVLTNDHQVSFQVAAYDARRPLVIDPILVYSTYLGGTNGGENGTGIAVDAAGNAYVTGHTGAIDFPTVNPLQPDSGGQTDVFVSKLNRSGSALMYSTYLGGSDGDDSSSIAVDASGSAYVTGSTASADFPTINAFQPVFGGGEPAGGGFLDAFVAKLDPTGSTLLYASYLGGSTGSGTSGGAEVGLGIAVDVSGNAYVTGVTGSTDFPTVNALQSARAGNGDAFVAKISASGNALLYSTYLGGGSLDPGVGQDLVNPDTGADIAVDQAGNAYVTGYTASSDFPTLNAFQSDRHGTFDAFVTKLNPTGSAIVYSTYIGGSGGEIGHGIAVDAVGNAYVTGLTDSTDFPTVNPSQSVLGGSSDAFVIKLNPAGFALVYSTYIGGPASDDSYGIAVDLAGNAYITGVTYSDTFPTTPDAFDTTFDGNGDGFVTKLNPAGSDFVYSTFLGGSEDGDYGNAIAVDSAGNAYVIGQTGSTDFPTTAGTLQTTGSGLTASNVTAFVAKIGGTLAFAGRPGEPNCHGKSVSALARQYRGINAAAAALGFLDAQALQEAIRAHCGR